jgi:GDPmannose 4,6-dehydratase
MWMILQNNAADDYVVASGQTHSVREFAELAFRTANLEWEKCVHYDKALRRPTEPTQLVGSAEKIKRVLGWKPRISFEELVHDMVKAELATINSTIES